LQHVQENGEETISMAQEPTRDVMEAFHDAVLKYEDWGGEPLPEVSLNRKLVPISSVCHLVMTMDIKEPLPEVVTQRINWFMHAQHQTLKEEFGRDPSYATGARCLLKLIEEQLQRLAAARNLE
jgi:hypothetical protein